MSSQFPKRGSAFCRGMVGQRCSMRTRRKGVVNTAPTALPPFTGVACTVVLGPARRVARAPTEIPLASTACGGWGGRGGGRAGLRGCRPERGQSCARSWNQAHVLSAAAGTAMHLPSRPPHTNTRTRLLGSPSPLSSQLFRPGFWTSEADAAPAPRFTRRTALM